MQEKDRVRMIGAVEDWIKRCPKPGAKKFAFGNMAVSPMKLLDALRRNNKQDQELLKVFDNLIQTRGIDYLLKFFQPAETRMQDKGE